MLKGNKLNVENIPARRESVVIINKLAPCVNIDNHPSRITELTPAKKTRHRFRLIFFIRRSDIKKNPTVRRIISRKNARQLSRLRTEKSPLEIISGIKTTKDITAITPDKNEVMAILNVE
ncbi:MAG: hypothetical protein AAB336_06665 [Acidobacteriota bacterium]